MPGWSINYLVAWSTTGLVRWKAFTLTSFPISLNFGPPVAHRLVALVWLVGWLVAWQVGYLAWLGLLAGKLSTPFVSPIPYSFGTPLRVD